VIQFLRSHVPSDKTPLSKKATSKRKPLETLPCPVCGRMPEMKVDHIPEGKCYYYTCKDSTILSFHEIYTQSWGEISQAMNRWNDAIKTLEKRKAKNIKDRETWG
jgi:hypothetical protein